jgi:hypothetical protein
MTLKRKKGGKGRETEKKGKERRRERKREGKEGRQRENRGKRKGQLGVRTAPGFGKKVTLPVLVIINTSAKFLITIAKQCVMLSLR